MRFLLAISALVAVRHAAAPLIAPPEACLVAQVALIISRQVPLGVLIIQPSFT